MTQRICIMPDCTKPHSGRGFCNTHLLRFTKYGDPNYVQRIRRAKFVPIECLVDGCSNLTTLRSYKGICELHRGRIRRTGTTDATSFFPTKDMDGAGVLHLRSEPAGDCVLWLGGLAPDGYPLQVVGFGLKVKAHRLSWYLANGPVPEGLTLDHLCHNNDPTCPGGDTCPHRRCINPDHLEPVTQAENGRRQWVQRKAHAKITGKPPPKPTRRGARAIA